eukprot:TRINITY_DN4026_c2_g1_i1.p1 TRINITY_DN4026_c2_g1~~TRINITY_DN4026_c2_g1_i1.p1  ORF type:complete len:1536 (+),score=366.43 TRINITY_DN4026_c2_g1_i1:38-4609(+)
MLSAAAIVLTTVVGVIPPAVTLSPNPVVVDMNSGSHTFNNFLTGDGLDLPMGGDACCTAVVIPNGANPPVADTNDGCGVPKPSLFSTQPSITGGTLTFNIINDLWGTKEFSVLAIDSLGDQTTVTFTIIIRLSNNLPPTYTLRAVPTVEVYEDSFGDVLMGDKAECRSPLLAQPRACQGEIPRELRIHDWVETFDMGGQWENQQQTMKWILKPERGEYFVAPPDCQATDYPCPQNPTIDDGKCPRTDEMRYLRMTFEPHAVGTTNMQIYCQDAGLPGPMTNCPETFFQIRILAVNDPPDACPLINIYQDIECAEVAGCVLDLRWLAYINPGGGVDESNQKLVSDCVWGPQGTTAGSTEVELFSTTPQLDVQSGELRVTLKEYAQGTGWVTCTLTDDGGVGPALQANGDPCDMDSYSFTLDFDIQPINNAPLFDVGTATNGGDISVEEDTGHHEILGWATKVSPSGDPHERNQPLRFECAAEDPSLFTEQPTVVVTPNKEGDLTFAAAPDVYGTVRVTCALIDDDTLCNAPHDCRTEHTFKIDISPVNDRPSLTFKDNPVEVVQGANIDLKGAAIPYPGADNEMDQTFTYTVRTPANATDLFVSVPQILPDGTLQFVTAADQIGSTVVEVVVIDSGGKPNDTSLPEYLTINVGAVNHAPSFILSTHDLAADNKAGVVTLENFATDIKAGVAEYENQMTLTFKITAQNPVEAANIFSELPEMTADGTLKFAPKLGATGVAVFSVILTDSGPFCTAAQALSGCLHENTSPPIEFVIQVGDEPPLRFTPGPTIYVDEDSGLYNESNWAIGIVNQTGLPAYFESSGYHASKFSIPPTIRFHDGMISFKPGDDVTGSFEVKFCLQAVNSTLSNCKYSKIVVEPINDEPSFELRQSEVFVTEGSGVTAIGELITALTAGPMEEGSQQTVTLSASMIGSCSFITGGIDIDHIGELIIIVNEDSTDRSCTANITATDSLGLAFSRTLIINLQTINNIPTFTPGTSIVWRSNHGMYIDTWARNISAGFAEGNQNLTFELTFDRKQSQLQTSMFDVLPTLDAKTGVLSFTPKANQFGVERTTVYVILSDGGTPPQSSPTSEFTITILDSVVYMNPSFNLLKGDIIPVDEDSGLTIITDWCELVNTTFNVVNYPHTVTVTVTSGVGIIQNAKLTFPDIDPSTTNPKVNGTLAFETKPDLNGEVTLDLLFDDGVTQIQRSALIIIHPVNDKPSFSISPRDYLLHYSSGSDPQKTIQTFAKDITAGPGEDATQRNSLNFKLDVPADREVLSYASTEAEPKMTIDGTLRFTLSGSTGASQIRVVLNDGFEDSEEVVFFVAVSQEITKLSARVASSLHEDPVAFRKAFARELGISLYRVAVHSWKDSAGFADVEFSIVDPDPGELAANTAAETTSLILSSPPAKYENIGTYNITAPPDFVPTPVAPQTPAGGGGGGAPAGGGGGGGGGDNNQMTIVIVCISIVAVAFIAGGVYYWRNLQKKKKKEEPEELSGDNPRLYSSQVSFNPISAEFPEGSASQS